MDWFGLAVRTLILHLEVETGIIGVFIQCFFNIFDLEPQPAGSGVIWAVDAGAAGVITYSASQSWAIAAASAAGAWDVGIGDVAVSSVARAVGAVAAGIVKSSASPSSAVAAASGAGASDQGKSDVERCTGAFLKGTFTTGAMATSAVAPATPAAWALRAVVWDRYKGDEASGGAAVLVF